MTVRRAHRGSPVACAIGIAWPMLLRFHRAVAVILALAVGLVGAAALPAAALTVDVRITITEVEALDEVDEPDGDADFFALVFVDGQKLQTDPCAFEDDEHIFPNWEFKKEGIDLSQGSVPVQIQIWDDDDPCPGSIDISTDDEHVDISSNAGRNLDFTLTLAPCSFSGDVSGSCGTLVSSSGTADDDIARIVFKVEVDEPPSAPGLNLRCWHTPMWPQPGDTVAIRVEVLDGNIQPDVKIADSIEVFLGNDQTMPAGSTMGNEEFTFTTDAVAAPSFSYACRVVDDGTPVWTGWRTVNVGPPPQPGGPVPIMFTGPMASRIDVVFIADQDNYTGAQDPNFLNDVSSVVQQAYFAVGDTTTDASILLTNQDTFNFWVASQTGDAEPFNNGCPHVPPLSWSFLYTFADAGAILHTNNFRDCAPGGQRLFSSEPTSITTVRHEQGHRPFSLADEYCCDGGYFQAVPFPNVYAAGLVCEADAPNLGRVPGACRSWMSTSDGGTWETSEPASGDLMVDNATPQAADTRRIDWMLNVICASASC